MYVSVFLDMLDLAKVGGGKAIDLLVYVLYGREYNSFTRGQKSISQEWWSKATELLAICFVVS